MNEYQHKIPTPPHHSPHKWNIADYGARTQWEGYKSNKPILLPKDIKYIQKVVEKFLYYAGAVDLTMLVYLVALAAA